MDLKQYVNDAVRTESRIDSVRTNVIALQQLLIAYAAIGSMLDQIKKNVYYNKPYDSTKFDASWGTSSRALDYFRPIEHFQHPTAARYNETVNIDPRLFHAVIGAITEAAELAEALQQALDTGSPDIVNVLEEFADINWYEAIALDAIGEDFETILERNIAKLKARFPDKFTSENAINRDLIRERAILEGDE